MADVTSPFGFPYPEDTDLVRDGATDIENLATGVNDYLTGGFLYAGTRYYTSSGTFAKADPLGTGDIGLRAIRVRMVGGGGGGGGAPATGAGEVSVGGGGGGGEYAERFITDIAGLSSSETITRGAAGSGATGAGSGTSGGQSSAFSVVVNGGGGGNAAGSPQVPLTAFGGGGGGGSGGSGTADLRLEGSRGRTGFALATDRMFPGGGGESPLSGTNQTMEVVGSSGNGTNQAATAYGSGGNGARNAPSDGTARTAGAGANGIVIVDCFV